MNYIIVIFILIWMFPKEAYSLDSSVSGNKDIICTIPEYPSASPYYLDIDDELKSIKVNGSRISISTFNKYSITGYKNVLVDSKISAMAGLKGSQNLLAQYEVDRAIGTMKVTIYDINDNNRLKSSLLYVCQVSGTKF